MHDAPFQSRAPNHHSPCCSGFTLLEVMIAGGLAALILTTIVLLCGQNLRLLNSARETSGATQALQERLEQLRRCSWTQVTSELLSSDESVPDDGTDTDSGSDFSGDFADDLSDASITSPGLAQVLATATNASAGLPGVVERITVVPFPPKSATPIKVKRTSAGVVIESHNASLSDGEAVKVTVNLAWPSRDNRTRTQEISTIIARAGK